MGHLAMALGPIHAANCFPPAAPTFLRVLTLIPGPWGHVLTLGLENPQIVAIQTCSGTTLHEKINIYIYSFLFVFKEGEKGNLCFLGELPLIAFGESASLGVALSAPRGAQ